MVHTIYIYFLALLTFMDIQLAVEELWKYWVFLHQNEHVLIFISLKKYIPSFNPEARRFIYLINLIPVPSWRVYSQCFYVLKCLFTALASVWVKWFLKKYSKCETPTTFVLFLCGEWKDGWGFRPKEKTIVQVF